MNKYLLHCILDNQVYPLTCKADNETSAELYITKNYAIERVANILLIEENCIEPEER